MEGRRHRRVHAQVGCWILRKDGESCCCSTFDISDNGISISTNTPLPVGQTVCLQFYTPLSASPLSISAEVIWSHTEHNGAMGLRFLDITNEQMEMLNEMTRQVSHRELNVKKMHGHR
jgi:c-di-GMP-binding flagellar brake protein YcgR